MSQEEKNIPVEQQRLEKEQIEDMGSVYRTRGAHAIHCLTVIGQVEGHVEAPQGQKTTKYEHVIPLLTVQPMLFRIFAGFLSAFLTVRRQETDRQTGFCQLIRNTALNIGFFQSAKVRVLLSKSSQPLFQSGVVGDRKSVV